MDGAWLPTQIAADEIPEHSSVASARKPEPGSSLSGVGSVGRLLRRELCLVLRTGGPGRGFGITVADSAGRVFV